MATINKRDLVYTMFGQRLFIVKCEVYYEQEHQTTLATGQGLRRIGGYDYAFWICTMSSNGGKRPIACVKPKSGKNYKYFTEIGPNDDVGILHGEIIEAFLDDFWEAFDYIALLNRDGVAMLLTGSEQYVYGALKEGIEKSMKKVIEMLDREA